MIERAKSWLRPSVPYSQTRFHSNEYGTYRTDCSGYASMALGLPGKPANRHGGLDTIGLASVSFEIEKRELLPGDLLLRSNGTNLVRHVAVFDRWADECDTAYWGFEQAGGIGTAHRIIHYPYDGSLDFFHPFRYCNLISKEQR